MASNFFFMLSSPTAPPGRAGYALFARALARPRSRYLGALPLLRFDDTRSTQGVSSANAFCAQHGYPASPLSAL